MVVFMPHIGDSDTVLSLRRGDVVVVHCSNDHIKCAQHRPHRSDQIVLWLINDWS